MANPFRMFRKHQRWLLATLGLGAMIAFCVPYAVFQGLGGSSQRNPVVVKTKKYGNIKEHELGLMRDQRKRVIRFVKQVQGAIAKNRTREDTPLALAASWQFLNVIGSASEQAVVTTWLFAKEAERQGMVVGDTTVNEFLTELTDSSVNSVQLRNILKEVGISEPGLFDVLKYELSALRLQQMIQPSLPATLPWRMWNDVQLQNTRTSVPLLHFQPQGAPPGQRWDYFTRLEQEASVEVAPVKVEDFVDEIADPGDKMLRAFFEQYKERFAHPNSPEPGFHEPHRVAVRYFKANAEECQTRKFISDDEVYEMYEQGKQFFDQNAAFFDSFGQKPEDEKQKPEDEKLKPEDEKQKPKDDDETKTESPDGETKTESPPSDESSSAATFSPFRFASYFQEDDATDATAGEDSNEEKKVGKVEEGKAEEKEEKKEEGVDKAETKEPAADSPKVPVLSPPEPPKPAKPKTREEIVAGGIGTYIRRQLAPTKMDEALNLLEEKMVKYRKLRNRYETDKLQNENAQPPEKLDFEALAKDYSPAITVAQTPLISQVEALDYDIGRSRLGGRLPFVRDAYLDDWQLYFPEGSTDEAGNQYRFWKNNDVAARVPKFEDEGVRAQVLKAWKMVQAREPAMEKAQQLAEKAAAARGPLAKALAGEADVTQTGFFSWMTVGNVPMGMRSPAPPPRRSNVDGVGVGDIVGDEFMQTVFRKLRKDGVGVAMNRPKTIAYVIRVREVFPLEAVLWADFKVDDYSKYSNVADGDIKKMIDAYREELAREANLNWLRPPDSE